MIQLASLPLKPPRISSNQVGAYVFGTPQKRLRILQDQKFQEPGQVSYYQPAQCAILRCLEGSVFDEGRLNAEWKKLEPSKPEIKYHQDKCRNNRAALETFIGICDQAAPTPGKHQKIQKNALLSLEGVQISVRPELITDDADRGSFSMTKLRFSKSRESLDESEIILLLLLKYGQQLDRHGLRFDLENTKLVDCFARTVIHGHTIGRHRYQQLHMALIEIARLWPGIGPKES